MTAQEHAPHGPRALVRRLSEAEIAHYYWQQAEKDALAALIAAQPGEVVCITGPSRAGKTHLATHVRRLLFPDHRDLDAPNFSGYMPTVKLHASNSNAGGQFSTKAFVLDGLEVVQHPFYSSAGHDWLSKQTRDGLRRTPESQFTSAFKEALRNRGVQYLFVDEVQHVRYASGGGRGAAAVLDAFKCLAEEAGIVLVVIGAYPILGVLEKSPHMQGRKHQVHLRRYKETKEDIREFNYILDQYSKIIPLPERVSLRQWNDTLYHGSLGCIGLLEMWLRECLAYLDDESEPHLTLERIKERQRPEKDFENIVQEIVEGEEYLGESKEDSANRISEHKMGSEGRQTRQRRSRFTSNARRYSRNGRA